MNTLVVYDTQFGNTEKVARAIGTALESAGPVRVVSLEEAPEVDMAGVELLVIGGPTQAHRARQSLRDWVDSLPPETLQRMAVATFDTRLSWPMIFSGSAARSIEHIVRHHHAHFIAPVGSFIVKESEGPLADGELERATQWAQQLAVKAGAATNTAGVAS
jgi:flavodoxin